MKENTECYKKNKLECENMNTEGKRRIIEVLIGEKIKCKYGELEIRTISDVNETVYLADEKGVFYPVLLSNIKIDESIFDMYERKIELLKEIDGVA